MKVTNNTAGVICAGKFIMPGQSAVIDETWAKNPIIQAYIKKGVLTADVAVKVEASSENDVAAMVDEAAALSAESSKRTLNAFAKRYSINVEGAETAEDIYAVIYAYVQAAGKNA